MSVNYIETQEAFDDYCELFKNSRFLCIDTEFHRESTYYPKLALIQMADEQHTVCIDPLALDNFQSLLALFRNPDITKVFHAAGQDLEIFFHDFDCLPSPIFDTQIAATLLGHGEQVGYAALVKICLDLELDKTQTRTDWLKRPLSQKQLDYAANDVKYLAQLFPIMEQQLAALGRLDWLQEDFSALSEKQTYRVDVNNIWRRVKGHQRLRSHQLAVLQQLAAWRETMAIERDRPRRKILPDDALIDLAVQKPQHLEQLRQLRSLSKFRISNDDLNQLVSCIQKGLKLDKQHWPQLPRKHKLELEQDALVDVLQGLLKLSAQQHNIMATSLASRKQLEALVRGETDLEILKGWRKLHGGQRLLDFLDGNLSLTAKQTRLVIE